MPCVVLAPSNEHAFTLVRGVQTGISHCNLCKHTNVAAIVFYTIVCTRNSGKRPLSFFHLFGRPLPYPRAMGTLDHLLALVHVQSIGLITKSKAGRSLAGENAKP